MIEIGNIAVEIMLSMLCYQAGLLHGSTGRLREFAIRWAIKDTHAGNAKEFENRMFPK